jgi:hypothetical protein
VTDEYRFDVDQELLVELGRLLFSSAYLEDVAHDVFSTLTGVPWTTDVVVAFQPFSWVVERSRWLCGREIEAGSQLDVKVREWLRRAELAQLARNRIVHASWYVHRLGTERPDDPAVGLGLRRFKRPKAGESADYEATLISAPEVRNVALECEATGLAGVSVLEWLNESFSRR